MTTRARVLVVGRGPHGVTVVHKLATWGNIAPEDIMAVDPNPAMDTFQRNAHNIGQTTMRSPWEANVAGESADSMRAKARGAQRKDAAPPLDVIIQRQVLDTFKELQSRLGLSVILITHDISVVAYASDRVVVMYAGEVIEAGATAEVLKRPFHPYTMGLYKAFPELHGGTATLVPIEGTPPNVLPPNLNCRPSSVSMTQETSSPEYWKSFSQGDLTARAGISSPSPR